MKKSAIVLILYLLQTTSALSYTIIADQNVFYSFFEKPKTTIEFTELRDGTTFGGISVGFKTSTFYAAHPVCAFASTGHGQRADSFEGLAVRPDAFSDAWSFMLAVSNKPDSYCEAIIWSDRGISTGNYKITVVAASGQSQPFVMYTNKGFIGILPDSPQENIFVLDRFTHVFSFETHFSRTSSELESQGSFLAGIGNNRLKPCKMFR